MPHRHACLQPSRVTALSAPSRPHGRPVRCIAASRASPHGASKAQSAAPVALPSSKCPTPKMPTAANAQAASTAEPPPDTRVTWDVDVITHIPDYAPSNIGLQLTVISVDGERREFQLEATKPPQKVKRGGKEVEKKDLPGRKDSFAIKLPDDFEPAAVWVLDKEDFGDKLFQAGGDYSCLYLKVITMNTGSSNSSSSEPICFIANTYISTQQGHRQFVRDDALSNPRLARNKVLAALMADELQELRGEGSRENEARDDARKDPDRIYRYATYNDLGGDIVKTPGNIREPLGGSSSRPYPRRIDTNRGTYPGTNYEVAPVAADGALVNPGVIRSTVASVAKRLPQPLQRVLLDAVKVVPVGLKVAPTPWTPQDDNFDTDKTRGFIGNAVTGVLPGVFTSIDAALGNRLPLTRRLLQLLKLAPGKEFDNVGDVLSLYDKQQLGKLAEGGVMAEAVPEGGSAAFGAQLLGSDTGKVNRRTGEQAKDGDSVLDLLKYDVPRSLEGRLSTWSTDEEMGRMFLAGQNPLTIEVLGSAQLQQLLQDSAGIGEAEPTIKGKLEGKSMQEWAAAGDAGEEPRLFVVDYWAIYGLLDTLESMNAGSDRVMHAGRCVMFRRSDGHLVPVIIELAHSTKQPIETYTSNDPPAVWQVAKAIFQSVDSGWHQLISHWLRTHACVEPYLIATRRRLPAAHPMFRLLMPHFRYTLPINAAARGSLINAGGVIEQNFSPGPFSMQLSSIVYGLTWRFKDEGHPADLKKRGFLDAAGNLRVKDYPFAEDGLLIWESLHKYFTAYVALYYADDAAVTADTWLQEWWTEVKTEAHPEAPADGWVDLDSRSNLVFAVCTMAWVASAHHAAVNFGQYDYSGWMPSHSSLCRRPAPARGSDAWQKLSQNDISSKEIFTYIAPPATATKIMSTVKLLSAHAQDEQYLSTDAQSWLPLETDPAVKAVFESFVTDIKDNVEPEIDRRNADPANISRNPATAGMPYTLLYPSSGPGVTMQGVPYSISI